MLAKTIIAAVLALEVAAIPVIILDTRQLHGTGEAADSLFTDTDNGVGYGIENGENNAASLIGGSPKPGPGTRRAMKLGARQMDKVANGAANVLNAAGAGGVAGIEQTQGDNIDGQLTDDQALVGAQLAGDEESTLESAGNLVPSKAPATRKL